MASSTKKTSVRKNIVKKVNSKESLTTAELKNRLSQLEKESVNLDKEIADLKNQGLTADLQPQMQALHEYNEMKDVTQMVLGYLSDAENVTLSELHKRYNLPME